MLTSYYTSIIYSLEFVFVEIPTISWTDMFSCIYLTIPSIPMVAIDQRNTAFSTLVEDRCQNNQKIPS